MGFQMEDFSDAKNTMENLNLWANEVNKKAKVVITGKPVNFSELIS